MMDATAEKKEWVVPTLTVLGDLDTLTASALTGGEDDGNFGFNSF